jgi:DNA-binding MarR family transcriptional regulator
VPLNISAAKSSAAVKSSPRRRQLVDELTAELTSWSPREFLFAFRRMHRGTVSLVHLNVLMLLEAEGPMSMGRLAEALDVSVASATGIVTRMETRGFVERAHDDHDRRVVLVRSTEAGAGVFRGIEEHRRAGLLRLLTHLTDDELAGFLAGHRALRAVRAAYQQEQETVSAAAQSAGAAPGEPQRSGRGRAR